MRITQITIGFTETVNLGDYSNTKPSVELTALLDAGDDVPTVIDELVATAKSVIHEKVDDELERVEKPPKYWAGARYDVIYSHTTKFVAIVPAATITQLDGGFYTDVKGVRYQAAQKAAIRKQSDIGHAETTEFFDCVAFDHFLTDFTTALREYTTEQNRLYEQRQQERRQAEAAERQRQYDEWEARRRREVVEDDEDEDDEDEDDEADDN